MMSKKDWLVLSHNEAQSEVGKNINCYERIVREQTKNNDHRIDLMLEADIIYWSSYKQFEVYTKNFPELKTKIHCAGLGKTLKKLKKKGIEVIPVIDMNHLKEICKQEG